MRYDILVTGNPVWELAWLVEELPRQGLEWGEIPHFVDRGEDGGGSAFNSACALAAAGRRVLANGQTGDDEDGRAAVAALQKRGVETDIRLLPGRTTKRNHLFVERATRATAFQVFLPPGAAPPLEVEPPALLEAGIFLLDRLPAPAPHWLEARRRQAAGINFLSRNTSVSSPAAEERLRRALPWVDILQIPEAAEDEAAAAGPAQEMANRTLIHRPAPGIPLARGEAERLLQSGVRILLRTRGSEGVRVEAHSDAPPDRLEAWDLPARPTTLIDPTGGGDAFTAGFIDGRLEGLSAREAAERGLDWAARACRYLGARAWLDHEPPGSSKPVSAR